MTEVGSERDDVMFVLSVTLCPGARLTSVHSVRVRAALSQRALLGIYS